MLNPNSLKAKPADNYDDLKKQFFALKNLCELKIKQCSIYSNKLAEYDRESLIARNEALESEKEMNAQLTEELAKANERVSELEKQFETQMTNDFVTTTDQAKRITELEKYNLDLANESHKYQERCAELEKELANKDLLHVGFTNGAQIKYAKVEEGAFYPDTEGDCYIPLYMLKSHEHRIETTSFEQLRKEQE